MFLSRATGRRSEATSETPVITDTTTLEKREESVSDLRAWLSEFYGTRIQATSDLETQACCMDESARRFGDILRQLPDEVVAKQYGCGSPIPVDDLTGLTALDLGCGAGTDVFVLAKLVGPTGFVHGLDMTREQLDVARRNTGAVMRAFGHDLPNVEFHEGFIETADPMPDASVDLVVSNCVINLSPRKDEVFRTIRRVLKPGGEVCFSDIVADRRVPEDLSNDPIMVAECLGGALYEHDLMDTMEDAGFRDARVESRRIVERDHAGTPIVFSSLTIRAFRFDEPLDRRCEDYGQIATYRGGIPGSEGRYAFDDHHEFERSRPALVCRNTARMLSETRLSRHFSVTEPVEHFGLFDCAEPPSDGSPAVGCC